MLATEMKRDLKVLELPWARCLNEVKAARVDIAIDAYDDAERRKIYQYSEPYYTLTPQVFYSTRWSAKVTSAKSASALAKLKGCGVHEYTYEHYDLDAEKMDRGAANDMQMIKKLLAGRCDYAVEELEYIVGQRRTTNGWPDETELRAYQPNWARGPKLHFLVGRTHPDAQHLGRQLDAGIAEFVEQGSRLRAQQRLGATAAAATLQPEDLHSPVSSP